MKSKKKIIIFLLISIIFISTGYYFTTKNKSNQDKTKILLIGLDGADWKVMRPLINQGKLPNIKKLMEKGCWGNLESFQPLRSEQIWTTIATGKEPREHGILDRLVEDPDTGESVPVTSNLRKVKAIWNILSEHKNKVGVVGYLVTWPVEEINGVMISDRAKPDTHYLSKDYSYPPFAHLCNNLDFRSLISVKNNISYKISPAKMDEKNKSYILNFIHWFVEREETRDNFMINFANYLLNKLTFDFFAIYLKGIDAVSHYCWRYLYPEGFDVTQEDVERYKDIIPDYYIYCDRAIGDFITKTDKDTVVVIVSDHGFKACLEKKRPFGKLNLFLQTSGLDNIELDSKKIIIKQEQVEMWWHEKNIMIYGDSSKNDFEKIRKEIKEIFKNLKIAETGRNIFQIIRDTKNGFVIEVDEDYIYKYPQHHILVNNTTLLNFNYF